MKHFCKQLPYNPPLKFLFIRKTLAKFRAIFLETFSISSLSDPERCSAFSVLLREQSLKTGSSPTIHHRQLNAGTITPVEARKMVYESALGLLQENLASINIGFNRGRIVTFKLRQQIDLDRLYPREHFEFESRSS